MRKRAVGMRHVLWLSTVFGALSCRAPVELLDERGACPQTYEFGNFGCAEVRGQVLGSAGQPLRGVDVGPRYFAGTEGGYNTYYTTTDSAGRFSFRVTRFSPRSAPVDPDTFSIYVRASVRPPPGGAAPLAMDSTLTRLTLAPLGSVPVPAVVTIRLDYP